MLTKVCTNCKIDKTTDQFSKQKRGKYGARATCKDCEAYYKKQYHNQNREMVLGRQKKYRQQNRKTAALSKKKWRQANPHRHTEHEARRRANKLMATPSWSNQLAIKALYKQAADAIANGVNLHVDHIVPLKSDTVCGLHCEANLQLLPASDNTSKGNRWWPDMW